MNRMMSSQSKIIRPQTEVTSLDHLKRHAIGGNWDWVSSWTIASCVRYRYKFLPNTEMDKIQLVVDYYGGVTKPILFADGELYAQGDFIGYGNKGCVRDETICTTFPLAWHETICGLDVKLIPPEEDQKQEESSESFQIHVSTLTGKTVELMVKSSDRLIDLKNKLQDKDGCPPDQRRIIYDGVELQDGPPLSVYNMHAGSTVHLVLRLRGGMYHYAAARDGFRSIHSKSGAPSTTAITVKYGPGTSDEFKIDINPGELHESFLNRVTERVTEIKNLEIQIDAIKRGGGGKALTGKDSPSRKKQKNSH